MKKKFYQNEVIKFNSMLYGDLLHIKTLTRTKRYLDNHFHVDVNLHVLALSQGFSKYHLLRLFEGWYLLIIEPWFFYSFTKLELIILLINPNNITLTSKERI